MSKGTGNTAIEDSLWVLVKIKNSLCALDSVHVKSIQLLEEEIVSVPGSDDVRLGIVLHRGGVIPVTDLRRLLGMVSRQTEQQDFEQMLEQRKQDHVHWVSELERCVHSGENFRLATDPHQCAFGKWYDHYEPNSHSVAFQLKKIDEPHRRLHEMAHKVLEARSIADPQEREDYLDRFLHKVTKDYMNQVISCLDETKTSFRTDFHRMMVVLADDTHSAGLLVDEVLSVEHLVSMEKGDRSSLMAAQTYVSQLAQRKGEDDLVLVLDNEILLRPGIGGCASIIAV